MKRVLLSSARHDWLTPESVLELVRRVGPIALDPCTTMDNPCGAERCIVPPLGDGLEVPWTRLAEIAAGGLIYCNPPYGRVLGWWVAKCIAEAEQGAEIIALVPSRTDTKWYRRAVESAQAIRHWHGRIRFRDAPHPAPFPSALIYWGPAPNAFHAAFAEHTVIGGVARAA